MRKNFYLFFLVWKMCETKVPFLCIWISKFFKVRWNNGILIKLFIILQRLIAELNKEQDAFIAAKPSEKGEAVAPWVGAPNEDALRDECLALSTVSNFHFMQFNYQFFFWIVVPFSNYCIVNFHVELLCFLWKNVWKKLKCLLLLPRVEDNYFCTG